MYKQMYMRFNAANRSAVWQSQSYFSNCEVDTNQVVTTVYYC